MDYTKNGQIASTINVHSGQSSVMVESESDLASLSAYSPGTIAFTAGFTNMWQLNASGEWIVIVEES